MHKNKGIEICANSTHESTSEIDSILKIDNHTCVYISRSTRSFFNIRLAIAIYDSKHIYVDIFRIFLLMCCTILAIFGCVQHFYFILCPLIFFIWVDLQNFLFLLTWRKILKWNLLRMFTWNLLLLTEMFIWLYIFEIDIRCFWIQQCPYRLKWY